MLMHVIAHRGGRNIDRESALKADIFAHRGGRNIDRESALKADTGRKIPGSIRELNPCQWCAFRSDALPTELARS